MDYFKTMREAIINSRKNGPESHEYESLKVTNSEKMRETNTKEGKQYADEQREFEHIKKLMSVNRAQRKKLPANIARTVRAKRLIKKKSGMPISVGT